MSPAWAPIPPVLALALASAAAAALAGCQTRAARAPAPPAAPADSDQGADSDPDLETDLAAAQAEARRQGRLLLVLVTESGRSPADAAAPALVAKNSDVTSYSPITVHLDLARSRNRAVAARFHLVESPLLVIETSLGIIVSRDEGTLGSDLVWKRIDAAGRRASSLDQEFHRYRPQADPESCLELADFLLAQGNKYEAIPYLAALRSDAGVDQKLQISAAVEEAQAHLWIGEPEKARHVAQELIATLGATIPEAKAAGLYALGAQDAAGRHHELGMHELDQAIAAAPDSEYARRARAERTKYPAVSP